MKRYIIFLLMLVYGLSATGTSLYLHFCCGQLDDVSFTVKHNEGCDQQGETTEGPCCNNVAIDLKLDADQQPAAKWFSSFNQPVVLTAAMPAWMAPSVLPAVSSSHWANAPPKALSALPVYLKNCVFRI